MRNSHQFVRLETSPPPHPPPPLPCFTGKALDSCWGDHFHRKDDGQAHFGLFPFMPGQHFTTPTQNLWPYYISRVPNQNGVSLLYIEGSQPEWCISSMMYSRDTPFWSETLDIMLEIHHSGREPSISCLRYTILVGNPLYHA